MAARAGRIHTVNQNSGKAKYFDVRGLTRFRQTEMIARRAEFATLLVPHSAPVGWVERSEAHQCAGGEGDGFRGACHRARVRATRWLYPSYGPTTFSPHRPRCAKIFSAARKCGLSSILPSILT